MEELHAGCSGFTGNIVTNKIVDNTTVTTLVKMNKNLTEKLVAENANVKAIHKKFTGVNKG